MSNDAIKARERKRRYLRRKRIAKYGPEAADVDMRGRHQNHARGQRNGRWAGDKLITSHGYVAVRVPIDHPHSWGPPGLNEFRYAYEHVVMMMGVLGRPLHVNEVVHHKNGNRQDNRPENLELLTTSEHAEHHTSVPGVRDEFGRFNSAARSDGLVSEFRDMASQEDRGPVVRPESLPGGSWYRGYTCLRCMRYFEEATDGNQQT